MLERAKTHRLKPVLLKAQDYFEVCSGCGMM